MMQIGFIGLGNMGFPMVCNLLKRGNAVRIYDSSPEAIARTVQRGAIEASSIAELAESVDVIITMLPTPPVVQRVVSGSDGILRHARSGALVIDCSTSDPAVAADLEKMARRTGHILIDAPVSGGVAGAEAGTLTFMVGASEAAFRSAQPVLSSMGKNIVHCGPAGSGQAAKLCNNLLLGVSAVAVSESMCLGVKLGLSPQVLAGIINTSSGRCWVSEKYNPYPGVLPDAPASNDFSGGFACELMIKDLTLALELAHRARQPLPMTALAQQLFQVLSFQGSGHMDISAIVNMFKK
jgi:3-hydroxyisobutyrate dehydrogenase